jgi:hypothetical protein
MNNKFLIIFTAIIIIPFAQSSEAKPKKEQPQPLLDAQTKQIIYNRVCNIHRSRQYTIKEIFAYTTDTIEANTNLSKMPDLANGGMLDGYFSALSESHNLENRRIVSIEARSLLSSVIKNKDCYN